MKTSHGARAVEAFVTAPVCERAGRGV